MQDRELFYSYQADLIWTVAEELGWPWATDKFKDFHSIFLYIGFLWNIDAKTVELLEKKKEKYLSWLAEWRFESKQSAKTAERLIGTLNHVCLVVPEGHAYLPNLYKFRSHFRENDSTFKTCVVHWELFKDIVWWHNKLSQDFVGLEIVKQPEPSSKWIIHIDASTSWGIGAIINGRWIVWKLESDWKANGQDIGWVEMVAVELAVRALLKSPGTKGTHFVIRSDNQGVVGALKAGKSRGSAQNPVLREIVKLIQGNGIWVTTTWISTTENLADAPSCGILGSRDTKYYVFPPRLPWHLKSLVKHIE